MTYFYTELREYFSPVGHYVEKVSQLETKVKEERFKHLLTSYEFQDFRAHVGTLIPSAIKEKKSGEASYPLRTLASVVQKAGNEKLMLAKAKSIFEEGKVLFREQKYELATERFNEVIRSHPYSVHVPETLFLLVESHFTMRNYDQCIQYVNKMLDIYPESELTGYALLRLGKIYELQDRHSEAIEIYKTVLKSFPDRGIASLASSSLRAVEL